MPVPIRPMNSHSPEESNMFVDYSFLLQQKPKTNKKQVVASNNDADILMRIWLEAETKNEDFVISSTLGLSSRDISRLKSYGLITGGSDSVQITDRGRKVITVMALGEGNKFEKGRSEKSYKEILASMDHRGKSGYRIPKFCSNNSNSLNISDDYTKQ